MARLQLPGSPYASIGLLLPREIRVATDRNQIILGDGISNRAVVGYTTMGAWSSAVIYFPNDVVVVSGTSYACILSHINQTPPNATYWAIVAEKGDTGTNGTNGTNGTDGKTVLSGTAAPTTEGSDGDFYIRTTTNYVYGPKAGGVWPAGISLVGPTGATGATGPAGADGADASYAVVMTRVLLGF